MIVHEIQLSMIRIYQVRWSSVVLQRAGLLFRAERSGVYLIRFGRSVNEVIIAAPPALTQPATRR